MFCKSACHTRRKLRGDFKLLLKNFTQNFCDKDHGLVSLRNSFQNQSVSIVGYLEKLFKHIEKENKDLNALVFLDKKRALERAKLLETQSGETLNFYGVPIVIKANMQKNDFPVTCASKMLENYKGQYTATALRLLEDEGAIIIASSNMDEFAMGSSNEYSIFGPVKNPLRRDSVSGGSSGGSAAACAAGFAPITLGSDTGGSVRQPASFCGVYGFRPSYGRVSRFGLVAFGSSFDQISPFSRSIEDIDTCLRVIGCHDNKDATSMHGSYKSLLCESVTNFNTLKIGIPKGIEKFIKDEKIAEAYENLKEWLSRNKITLVDLDIDCYEYALSVYYVISSAEASSNLARFDGIRYGYRAKDYKNLTELYCHTRSLGFGDEVKRRIMIGNFALSSGYVDEYYNKASELRKGITKEFNDIFNSVNFILSPTTPFQAFKIGEVKEPLEMHYNDIFTVPASLAGCPAVSVPISQKDNSDIAIGFQFMAKSGKDAELLKFIYDLENNSKD